MEEMTEDNSETISPRVFVSYSWTTQQHQELVKAWADRLLMDGVQVIIDIYDLEDGQDTNVFMEKMVTDSCVTNVLIFCDKGYSEKADTRTKGVGIESQIISQEIYEKVEQTKFIPIVCQFRDDGTPFIPLFLKSRRWIDFSSPEKVNENWERLVRNLFGKQQYEKPQVGDPPTYLRATSTLRSPAGFNFELLRQSIMEAKPLLSVHRKEFLDACVEYADKLRVKERPDVEALGQKVLADCRRLVLVRDHIIDWVLLESEVAPSDSFSRSLVELLEKLGELRSRPTDANEWNDSWYEAHQFFAYESFLYIVASLLKTGAFNDLYKLFTTHYILPVSERTGYRQFMKFDEFYAYTGQPLSVLKSNGGSFRSPAAELMRRQATRSDLPFSDLVQADLLTFLLSLITPGTEWYPQLMHYHRYADGFPFFVRATRQSDFAKLANVTGIANADVLRERVEQGYQRLGVRGWQDFVGGYGPDFRQEMNLDKLNSLS